VVEHSKQNDKVAEDHDLNSCIGVLGVFQKVCFLLSALVTAHPC